MGLGLHTKITQVAARELGLSVDKVRITATRTDKVPNTSPTAASSGADLNGMATRDACLRLKMRLLDFAAEHLAQPRVSLSLTDGELHGPSGVLMTWGELIQAAYLERISLSDKGFYATPDIHYDRASGTGRPFYYYAFGAALEADTTTVIKEKGGTVVGGVKHPLNASDFSSFLLQAQNSKAQILGLANAGGDTINSIKAAREFGINKTMKTAGLLVFLSDIHSLGLKNTEGLLHTTSWYWDLNDDTRKFANRFYDKTKRMPTDIQAADYSATMTYLKAVQAAKTTDADKVMAQLKSMKIDDFYGKGQIRADGSFIHDMYLVEAKSPAESKKPWDYLKVLKTLPGDQVFTTKAETKCALWK